MQVEFSAVVQAHADAAETEIASSELWSLFQATYLRAASAIGYIGHHLFEVAGSVQGVELELQAGGRQLRLRGRGNGPIAATVDALGLPLRIDAYEERALSRGADASALAIVEAARSGTAGTRFGVGIHSNIITASILAVLSAAARLDVTASDLKGEPLGQARSA
jgi:2-isopropylmalate synthase